MYKTFKSYYKYLFKSKWRLVAYLVLLFIPFIYGFIYMNAYWSPFKNSGDLKVAIVNLNKNNNKADTLKTNIIKDGKTYKIGDKDFPINFTDETEHIYSLSTDPTERTRIAESWVNNNDYSAILIIPDQYNGSTKAPDPEDPKYLNDQNLFKKDWEAFTDHHVVEFYNSYKNNFLAGEMTNFIAGLKDLNLASAYPGLDKILNTVNSLGIKIPDFKVIAQKFVHVHTDGKNINTYGFGLSPYFISIALWAGCLTITFLIKNERHIPGVKTIKHYFGATLVWLLTGWAQATILLTAITLQGVNLGWEYQWEIWLFVYFVSAMFSMLVQGVVFGIRYGDIGDFVVVIMLVLQLVASSGTFPVEMQNIIFKILHPVVPFTYSVQGIREIFYQPDTSYILMNMGILAIFPVISMTFSIIRNHIFDKKTLVKTGVYESFEIHMGDL